MRESGVDVRGEGKIPNEGTCTRVMVMEGGARSHLTVRGWGLWVWSLGLGFGVCGLRFVV